MISQVQAMPRREDVSLTPAQTRHFLERGFSRRSFGRLATLLTAASTLPFYNEFSLAQQPGVQGLPAGAVKIDTNENPLGPCPEAADAIRNIVKDGGRYMFHLPGEFERLMAETEGLQRGCVQAYPGSSMALHWSVLAFTSPARPFVIADPGYEPGESAARFVGAKVIRVPLTSNYSHDVKAMASADPNAGCIYVCNPNNPSGTLTSRADIEYLLAHKPAGSIILLDEAYIHFTDERGCADLVAAGKDLIILRTFSKVYGMAGLRAGAALARPDLLAKIRLYGNTWMPITSMVGAMASLRVKNLVAERRKITRETREDVFRFLEKHNFRYVPSVANFFMVDVGRPGRQVGEALRRENVYVGRTWPSWPTHVRVTVGTPEEMDKFKAAFLKVMA
jgi:histidinol-phosphate aminotransferase